MNILQGIDDNIINLLQTINTSDGTYKYKTVTGTINIDDEMLSTDLNGKNESNVINYNIEYSPINRTSYSEGSNLMTVETTYTITANMQTSKDAIHPKRDIKRRFNELIPDINILFGSNPTLNKHCNWFLMKDAKLEYAPDKNHINAGKAIFRFECNYSSYILDPDRLGCETF